MATDTIVSVASPIFDSEAIGEDGPDITPPTFPLDNESPFTDEHENEGAYKQYLIDTKYVLDTGVSVQRVTGDPDDETTPTNVKTRTGFATMLKIVNWTIERDNNKPIAPDPDTGDPNEILVESTIYPAIPLENLTSMTWRISGIYVYQLLTAKTVSRGSKFPAGKSAAEKRLGSANYYGQCDFSKTILDSSFALESDAVPACVSTPLAIPLPAVAPPPPAPATPQTPPRTA